MIHVNIQVTGKVQGVNYRYSTGEKAVEFGLSGFVRNEHDGSVYIEAEGSAEQIEKLVAWCKQGPSRSQVATVNVRESEVRGFEGFEIRKI